MTTVRFLFGTDDRQRAAGEWLHSAYQQQRSVVVFQPDEIELAGFDRWLWSHPATGFLPHCLASGALAAETPIVLASRLDAELTDECLLNLSNEIPQTCTRYAELIEIISNDESIRSAGRERFRVYRERGYAIESINLSATLGVS